jgi:predicted ATP-grasp superfamily ATP-dependent carboligase
MSTVLVTDAGRGSSIAIIRSLGRRGMRVVAADSSPHSAGFRSRYASDTVVYPRPDLYAGETVDVLEDVARTCGVDLIVPVTDDTVLPLSNARHRFAGVSLLAIPEPDALARAADKLATLELARELGVPTPRTALVTTADEARDAVEDLGWPVVLKPQSSRRYEAGHAIEAFGVSYAADVAGLERELARIGGRCPVLLQEYGPGEAHGVELLLAGGRPLAAFQHRRLHEVPITGGASSLRESVPLSGALYEHAVALLSALEWTGLAMVEFKVGADGPRLMEINGRIWGSLPLAVKSGMDFPARLADLYLGGDVTPNGRPSTAYRTGVRSRNLELEVVWIGSTLRSKRRYPFLPAPRRAEAVTAAARLVLPRDGYDILSADDPRPGLAELGTIMAKIAHKIFPMS